MRLIFSKTKRCAIGFVFFSLLLLAAATPTPAQGTPVSEPRHKELPNFGRVHEKLYRGGQPRRGGIQKLAALGVNTIINLRDDDERAAAEANEAKAEGLRYFNVPLKRWGRPADSDIDRILSLIDAKDNGVVFVHCNHGWDRVGTVIAIYRISHDEWTDVEAKKEARRFGMKFWQVGMKDYISDYFRDKSPRSTRSKKASPRTRSSVDHISRPGLLSSAPLAALV